MEHGHCPCVEVASKYWLNTVMGVNSMLVTVERNTNIVVIKNNATVLLWFRYLLSISRQWIYYYTA